MAKKPETIFKEKVMKELGAIPNCFAEKIQQVGVLGTPDVFAVAGGWPVVIELKKDEREKPDPIQEYKLLRYEQAGAKSYVANPKNWKQIEAEIYGLATYKRRN